MSIFPILPHCGVAGPCDFDVIIDLNDVFTFNGTGNLLLDIRIRVASSTNAVSFDAQNINGDSVGRVFNESGNVNAADGTTSTTGLVTKFFLKSFTPSS